MPKKLPDPVRKLINDLAWSMDLDSNPFMMNPTEDFTQLALMRYGRLFLQTYNIEPVARLLIERMVSALEFNNTEVDGTISRDRDTMDYGYVRLVNGARSFLRGEVLDLRDSTGRIRELAPITRAAVDAYLTGPWERLK